MEVDAVSRADYDQIKQNFADYIKTWNTRNLSEIDRIFRTDTAFKTSTSIRMANGNQDSIYGVYDFINDFPPVDVLYTPIYNYACRVKDEKAYSYGEIVCTAFDVRKNLDYFEFTVFMAAQWVKDKGKWKIVSLRQEVVPHHGTMREKFEKYWHLEEEDQTGGRIQMLRGEGDAPWYNVKDTETEDVLTEKEKIKDCVTFS